VRQVRSLDEIDVRIESACTIGSYDGIHTAHQEIIREVRDRARKSGLQSVVVTFDPHPKEVVRPRDGRIELLTTLEDRVSVLETMDIDLLFIIPFTYEFSRLTSRDFYQRYIVEGLGAREVVVGYDHMFGRDRQSGIADIEKFGAEFGFRVQTVPPYYVDGEVVSSSQIRRLLKEGDVERAAEFLGWRYSFRGSVVRGDGRGAAIGFPTANIQPADEKKLIPGNGVYFVTGDVRGESLPGMMNIGTRPTFGGAGRVVEVHFFRDVGDIYGESLRISFYRKLRDERKFDSVEELKKSLENDRRTCLHLIETEFDTITIINQNPTKGAYKQWR
jgi:riboflavin kinase / FMN adenylyltransferase